MPNHETLWPAKFAAEYLGGLSVSTLAEWREKGTGPSFRMVGRAVRYSKKDIDSWLYMRRRQRVSDSVFE